jgi:hypothetical protein
MTVDARNAIDCLVGKVDVQVGRRCPSGNRAKLKVMHANEHSGDLADDYLKQKRRLVRLSMPEGCELSHSEWRH